MPLNTRLSDTVANAEADALAGLLDNGYLRLYSGIQPATANVPVSTQTLLAELRFGSPAFGPSSHGTISANSISPDNSANATGTATWFRCLMSDGTTAILDGSVGTSGSNINMNSNNIQQNAIVSISSFVHAVTE